VCVGGYTGLNYDGCMEEVLELTIPIPTITCNTPIHIEISLSLPSFSLAVKPKSERLWSTNSPSTTLGGFQSIKRWRHDGEHAKESHPQPLGLPRSQPRAGGSSVKYHAHMRCLFGPGIGQQGGSTDNPFHQFQTQCSIIDAIIIIIINQTTS
jgi:hypothetical protein